MQSGKVGQVKTKQLRLILVAFVSFMLSAGLIIGKASAADDDDEKKYADVKTVKRHAVGKACAKRLEGVQEVLGAETEPTAKQFSDLAKQLPGYMSKDCSSSYEKSNVYNMLGFVYYSLEDYNRAIDAYQKMLNEPEVDPKQALSTRYTVAQLYMLMENYQAAVRELERWMKESPIIGDVAKILLAQGYYQIDRKDDALRVVNEVVSGAEAKGELPKESWWGLQRVLYYEKEDYKKVVEILKKMVTHYPSISYWKQLGGMYAQLEQDMNQLVSTEIVYLQNGLDKESQLLGLAYLYLGAGAPYRAALYIEKGMKSGLIERNGKNLELLGSAWQQAQSFENAAKALEEAAKKSGKGEIYARLAGVYLDQNRDEDSVRAAKNAINKGGLKRPEITYLTLGSANVNLHCYKDAVTAFREAAKTEKVKKAANQWIAYATAEGERRNKLISAGAKISGCKSV